VTHWISVDDHVLPAPISGHPALELCNTRSGWGEGYDDRQEFLRTLDHLVVLARHHEVLDDERASAVIRCSRREGSAAAEELARARTLRADLYAVLVGDAGRTATGRLTDAVSAARRREVLASDDDGFGWRLGGRPSLSDPLDAFLVAAGALLTARPPTRVGVCPGHDCGWLFANPSGRRRWCQMAVCGNRAKQARWAQR
jgi:predicted RNA-binding Zn ribbon-like protein